jgi:hypothetical protein
MGCRRCVETEDQDHKGVVRCEVVDCRLMSKRSSRVRHTIKVCPLCKRQNYSIHSHVSGGRRTEMRSEANPKLTDENSPSSPIGSSEQRQRLGCASLSDQANTRMRSKR